MVSSKSLTRREFVGLAAATVPMWMASGVLAASERSDAGVRGIRADAAWVTCGWRSDPAVGTLVAAIQFGDCEAREAAANRAVLVGSPALMPLCEVAGGSDPNAARAARRALRRIVRHCARAGADDEARSCSTQLARLREGRFGAGVRAEAGRLLDVAVRSA